MRSLKPKHVGDPQRVLERAREQPRGPRGIGMGQPDRGHPTIKLRMPHIFYGTGKMT